MAEKKVRQLGAKGEAGKVELGPDLGREYG